MQLDKPFRLFVLFCAFVALPAFAQTPDPGVSRADSAAMEHCQLTLDILKRFYQAQADLEAAARGDPKLVQKLNGEPVSIDNGARMLQSEPTFVAALLRNGFAVPAYTVVQFTVVQTVFALLAKQEGAEPAVLAGLHVAPGNIALFEQHGAEIDGFRAKSNHR